MTDSTIIAPDDVHKVWDSVSEYISRCDGYASNSDDMLNLILAGKRFLALITEEGVVKGAFIFREINGLSKKILITTLGGDGADWSAALDDFVRQIKQAGYRRVEIQGRRGWGKILPGFDELHTTIVKDI